MAEDVTTLTHTVGLWKDKLMSLVKYIVAGHD